MPNFYKWNFHNEETFPTTLVLVLLWIPLGALFPTAAAATGDCLELLSKPRILRDNQPEVGRATPSVSIMGPHYELFISQFSFRFPPPPSESLYDSQIFTKWKRRILISLLKQEGWRKDMMPWISKYKRHTGRWREGDIGFFRNSCWVEKKEMEQSNWWRKSAEVFEESPKRCGVEVTGKTETLFKWNAILV